MSIIAWIVLGLIAGFIGSKLVNKEGEGFFLDIVLGIVGAVIGGWLFSLFGMHGVTGLNLYSLVVAVIGLWCSCWSITRSGDVLCDPTAAATPSRQVDHLPLLRVQIGFSPRRRSLSRSFVRRTSNLSSVHPNKNGPDDLGAVRVLPYDDLASGL
jgi:uncharacterized membrane protein YeaQ/YmgE (transglycosylase-associated protein family)